MRTGSQPVAAGFAENPWPALTDHQVNASASFAPCAGVGERTDDLQLPMTERATVRHDQRQRVLVRERTWMK
jgi:hypothetical protein